MGSRGIGAMMKKVGLLFPGQGSQYVGMVKELYSTVPDVKNMLDQADSTLGFDLSKIILEGPDEVLKQTKYTQPAIFAVSMALYEYLKTKIPQDKISLFSAGHSLGEYSAMCAAGVFSFQDGLKLVKSRDRKSVV